MDGVQVFDYVCREIERRTGLGAAIVRGTLRLSLKEAGLDSDSVNASQMKVVVERILPSELAAHGIEIGGEVCEHLAMRLSSERFADASDRAGAAASILERLGA
jgi:hypothetical protein